MSISLREARRDDRDVIVDFIHILNVFEKELVDDRRDDLRAASAYFDELMQRLNRRGGRVILAEENRRPVGMMGFSLDEDAAYITENVRRHGTVTDLVVHQDWRGKGIGRLLLQEAERLTRAAGCKRLLIGVLTANEQAASTYHRFGFTPYVSILTKDL